MEITLDQNSDILGPFLCRPGTKTMSFWMCTPTNSTQPVARVNGQMITFELLVSSLKELPMAVWIGTAEGLCPNTAYQYTLSIDGQNISFADGAPEDFSFRTLRENESADEDKFILMSCHGVEEYQKEFDKGIKTHSLFNMWSRILKALDADSNIRFGFLAGDQVYMDDTFGEFLVREKTKMSDKEILLSSFKTYQKFWSDSTYRKVLARVPFFLMWDDHDLIDGWGSRDEQNLPNFKEKWIDYFRLQKEVFRLMQHSRNPKLSQIQNENFYFSFEHGKSLFSVLDLRSERDITKKIMLSDQQKKQFTEDLNNSESTEHFIVSSVTMARMNGAIEKAIGKTSNLIWELSSRYGYEPNLKKVSAWLLLILFVLSPRAVSFSWFHIGLAGLLSALTPVWFWLRYSKKVEKIFKKSAICYFCVFFGAGLLVAGIDSCFSNSWTLDPIYSLGAKEVIYLVLALSSTYLASWSLIAKCKLISQKLSFISIGLTWCIYFLKSETAQLNPLSSWFLTTIAILGIVFAILEASGTLDMIAGLDDDTEDSWSSDVNAGSFSWLLGVLRRSSKQTTILTGDIHTGGVSQMILSNYQFSKKIPQVVASPISYPPMSYIVEKLTSSAGLQSFSHGEFNLKVYNLFYRSQRNFCVIGRDSDGINAEFCFEDLERPMNIRNIHDL